MARFVGDLFLLLVHSPFLAVCPSQARKKSGKNCERRKPCPMAETLCESERVSSTAVGRLQYFLILTAALRQTAVAPDLSLNWSSESLRRARQRTDILVRFASGLPGRGQALGQRRVPNT
ncbi:hypothetical protein VZT92_006011 [Zoarces viviparus]|uniref:Uncharacterized protein n=1 Tax=Zoarces viviparus TaxID=48416 RepID=A0AAW1FPV2_ZOAVI